MHVAGGEYTLQPVTACILTSVIHGTDCLGNTGVWNEHLPNNRSSFWRGKIFIPNASWCVRACKNSMCKRPTSAVPRKQPAWNPDSISVFGIILEKGDNNLSRLFPKYYSLLMVLWSLTSAWWLFQRNLPAANLCTCIIASVKLICLFASILLTVATSWQRMSNRLFVIVFLVSEVRNIFLPIDKATVIQSRASVENDFPAVWFSAVFIWEGFRAKLLPPILLGNETGEDVQHLGALEGNVHLFLLSAAEKPEDVSALSQLSVRTKDWGSRVNEEGGVLLVQNPRTGHGLGCPRARRLIPIAPWLQLSVCLM